MSALSIRDARPEEREKVDTLTRAAYAEFAGVMEPGAWGALEAAVGRVLKDPGPAQCIVADDDGRLVGSVFLYPAGVSAYAGAEVQAYPEIRLLAIAPNARRRGVGRALVHECIRRASASGATELGLHTSKSLGAAIAMYEAMGFTRVPSRDFQPDGAELVQGYHLVLGRG
jgi:ribosomal protein S18 acetylase RimI-like enzyme